MRKSGILMHISSLASDYGIGTIGKKAYEFVDFLKRTSQSYWQVLPLNPTDYGNSPYQSPSVFAGKPLLIDPDTLISDGLLTKSDLDGYFYGDDEETVDFTAVKSCRSEILKKAFMKFRITPEYIAFESENDYWLNDYALFMAVKNFFFTASHGMIGMMILNHTPSKLYANIPRSFGRKFHSINLNNIFSIHNGMS